MMTTMTMMMTMMMMPMMTVVPSKAEIARARPRAIQLRRLLGRMPIGASKKVSSTKFVFKQHITLSVVHAAGALGFGLGAVPGGGVAVRLGGSFNMHMQP